MGKFEKSNTKLCKYCQTEIPYKAKVCPNCRKRIKGGKLKWVLLALIVVILIASYGNNQNQRNEKPDSLPSWNMETTASQIEYISPPETTASEETWETQETQSVQKETIPEIETETVPSSGIRPEFKEAMDSYEEFYNEYCDLLKKYTEDPTDLGLLAKYGEMLKKVEKMDEAFKAWDQEEMTSEELKYYMDVNNRVVKRLIDVAGN